MAIYLNLIQILNNLLLVVQFFGMTTALGFGDRESPFKSDTLRFKLIPSQVIKSARRNSVPKNKDRIPSHSIYFQRPMTLQAELNSTDVTFYSQPNDNLLPPNIHVSHVDSKDKVSKTKRSTHRQSSMIRQGNLPDLEWRAIPMEHLRSHPLFQSLPLPHQITDLHTMEDVRYFRQGTWQWDVLHKGRCTTSQLSAALGFLESKTGKALGIPRSLQKGSMGAYHRLSETPWRTLEELKYVLCNDEINGHKRGVDDSTDVNEREEKSYKIWKKMNRNRYPFAAKYNPQISHIQLLQAKRRAAMRTSASSHGVRMVWGSTQEATAILTAINYVSQIDPGVIVYETGMCGAGLEINRTTSSEGLLVGASPDAIIQYSNGSLEALEVKNHCPFVLSHNQSMQYRIREMPLDPTVPSAYLPQLMMEIICLGSKCNSAMMVRQTATSGAVILRVYRDDLWIEEMFYWLNKFNHDYVSKKIPPPENFFWDHPRESRRYRAFVEWTKQKAETVELVAYINNNFIQRVTSESGQLLPLFLD